PARPAGPRELRGPYGPAPAVDRLRRSPAAPGRSVCGALLGVAGTGSLARRALATTGNAASHALARAHHRLGGMARARGRGVALAPAERVRRGRCRSRRSRRGAPGVLRDRRPVPRRLLPRLSGPRGAMRPAGAGTQAARELDGTTRSKAAASGVTVSSELSKLRLCLVRPESHIHRAVHRQREPQVLFRPLPLADATVELAEAQMAVGDERAHSELLRQRKAVGVLLSSAGCVDRVAESRYLGQ